MRFIIDAIVILIGLAVVLWAMTDYQ